MNAWAAIESAIAKEKPKWTPNMTYRDYCQEHKRKFGRKSLFDSLDELKGKGTAEEIVSNVAELALEAITDPLMLVPLLKGLKPGIKPGKVPKTTKGKAKANPNQVKVNWGQQDKHIPGTDNYKQSVASGKNRGILKEDPQKLLDERAGTGYKIPETNRERVDFGRVIGQYYDDIADKYIDTTKGIIHYDSKGGAHIVPARP